MSKIRKIQNKSNEIIKEVEKTINNSDKIDMYAASIERVSHGYAEKIARQQGMKVINCPGFDFGVRMLAKGLLYGNVISAEKLFNFLNKNSYRKIDEIKSDWWIEKEG